MGQELIYKVARLSFCLNTKRDYGYEHLLPSLRPFAVGRDSVVDGTADDFIFRLVVDDTFVPGDGIMEIGQFDCGGNNHGVYQTTDGGYQIVISDVAGRKCCVLQTSADFAEGRVVLRGDEHMRQFGLNNAVMIMYAFSAIEHETLLMHSSVIRYDGRGYLFLGVSGTGKSTHTSNWLRFVDGAELMNDDNPVVRIVDGCPMVFGSPWSGKTPCYKNIEAEVGAFVQLRQAPHNNIRKCAVVEAFTHLLPSCSVMKWDRRVYIGICDTINKIMRSVPVYCLENLPDEAAVRMSFDAITGAIKT